MNAKRQLHNPVNDPATRGARTKPKLPNRPLKTRVVPVLDVLETNYDIPKGWQIEANNPIPRIPKANVMGVSANPLIIINAPVL